MKPCITKGILLSIRKKTPCLKLTSLAETLYKSCSFANMQINSLKSKLCQNKCIFTQSWIKTKKNSRETWKIIRSVLPSKSSREAPSSVRLNNMTTSEDPTTVANKFNNFFCTVGQNLAEKIEQVPNNFFDKKVISSCYFDPPTLTEVFDRIMALKDKAVGHDNDPFFLKAARHVTTFYLHQLIKCVFTEGLFPRSCKIARIAPIYKNGAKDETTNYRPISVLTCFSKIIEKLMYVRFIKFIKKQNNPP